MYMAKQGKKYPPKSQGIWFHIFLCKTLCKRQAEKMGTEREMLIIKNKHNRYHHPSTT